MECYVARFGAGRLEAGTRDLGASSEAEIRWRLLARLCALEPRNPNHDAELPKPSPESSPTARDETNSTTTRPSVTVTDGRHRPSPRTTSRLHPRGLPPRNGSGADTEPRHRRSVRRPVTDHEEGG